MEKGLESFVVGFGNGYLDAKRQNKLDEERQADRAMRKQEFDARMDGVIQQKAALKGLADASKPLGMTEESTPAPPDPATDQYGGPTAPAQKSYRLSDGRVLGSKAEADTAVADYSKPEARTARLENAYMANGQPEKAVSLAASQKQGKLADIQLTSAAFNQKRAEELYTQEQQDHARKLQEEGVFQAVRALRAGDASGVAKAFNAGGQYKLDGDPVITKEGRDVPGIGKIPTYTAKMRMVGPDGQVMEKTYNSHDLSMQVMPYEKSLELQRKGTDTDNKATYQAGLFEARKIALEAKAEALKNKDSGSSKEERLRYTSLFSEAGRRMGEAQRAMGTLQKDPLFMTKASDPKTPEYAQLQELRNSIKSYGEERGIYQGLLAGSQSPGVQGGMPPGLASAQPKASATGKPNFSSLWK